MNGDGDTPQKSDKKPEGQERQNTQTQPETSAEVDAGWAYKPERPIANSPVSGNQDAFAPPTIPLSTGPTEVTWTASEYVAHDKGFNWYVLLVVAAVGVAAIVWFLTKDYISVAVILIVSALLGVAAKRQPRVLEYAVDHDGFEIDGKFYSYGDFKSFSVMQEGAFSSVMLIPLKRFAPPISIYYSPDDEEKIINVIAQHLPLEEREHDMIDRFAKRIRF